MSHTIGQTQQDNQQSNSNSAQANQDSPQPESTIVTPTAKLSDTDYEFLFNQLLEGIAHGWHDRRIIKFFQQLGDRGEQAGWVNWLDRIRAELIKLPVESKRQLGTIMIRFGELTQYTTEVDRIGAASYRIGRELLFGNSQTVIWEYVGSDLISEVIDSEVEQEISERLPTDFSALGVAVESTDSEDNDTLRETSAIETETMQLPDIWTDSVDSTEVTGYNKEFDWEFSSQPLEEALKEPKSFDASEMEEVETLPDTKSVLSKKDSKSESSNTSDVLDNKLDRSPSLKEADPDNSAINLAEMAQVMNLIQSDEELAKQISQKLNITTVQSEPAISETKTPLSSDVNELDESTLELVESWFNLGLKHVSAGEFSKAIASWEKALKIDPNLSEAWHNRGSALGRLGNYEAAVESFQNALTIDPNNYQAWNDRAHALYQLQKWLEAVNSWSNAIKIVPGNHLFWYNRGCALEQLEKWQDAIGSYEKALEIKPDFQPGRSRYINLVADNSRVN